MVLAAPCPMRVGEVEQEGHARHLSPSRQAHDPRRTVADLDDRPDRHLAGPNNVQIQHGCAQRLDDRKAEEELTAKTTNQKV